ncbi:MAG: ammonium transporter, partial [Planctomycetota bacterium]
LCVSGAGTLLGDAGNVAEVAKEAAAEAAAPDFDSGHTAWMLVCCALVLLMTPGLALFYGGMVRTKNVLATMMHSMICLGVITVQWVVIGYTIAFGPTQGGWFGGLDHMFLAGIDQNTPYGDGEIPQYVFVAFQMMFAIITPALISGAFAERVKFWPFVIFTVLWATLVYDPLAHWVWGGGLLAEVEPAEGETSISLIYRWFGTGAVDFAGGTVVHISSGFSALIAILILGRRKGYPQERILPNNLVLSVIGAGMLWFGWFGFNGGSGLLSDGTAVNALLVTHICAAVGALSWSVAEVIHHGKVSMLGVITGLVAGLVCITPAAGTVDVSAALIMGLLVGPVCYFAVAVLKSKLNYDDSLDAFGVHGVGGILGAVLSGVFLSEGKIGFDLSGQLGAQIVSVIITMAYAGIVTAILVIVIDKTMGFRASEEDEVTGLDVTEHGESGYNF